MKYFKELIFPYNNKDMFLKIVFFVYFRLFSKYFFQHFGKLTLRSLTKVWSSSDADIHTTVKPSFRTENSRVPQQIRKLHTFPWLFLEFRKISKNNPRKFWVSMKLLFFHRFLHLWTHPYWTLINAWQRILCTFHHVIEQNLVRLASLAVAFVLFPNRR